MIIIILIVILCIVIALITDKQCQEDAEKWNKEHPDDPKSPSDFGPDISYHDPY